MVVVSVGSREQVVGERTARIILWLMSRSARLTRPDKVQVTFHCARKSVQGEITEIEDVPRLE